MLCLQISWGIDESRRGSLTTYIPAALEAILKWGGAMHSSARNYIRIGRGGWAGVDEGVQRPKNL